MKFIKGFVLIVIACAFMACGNDGKKAAYKDATLSVEKRVDDLLSRMTLEEKVGQLMSRYDNFTPADVENKQRLDSFFTMIPGMLQPDVMGLEENIAVRNGIQKYMLEQTRLGIPMIFVDEALHGPAKAEATSFPQAVALGCTWNPELVEQVFNATAAELRSRGTHFVLSPVVDVMREPRWGRSEECYGEDPFMNGKMGAAAVRGLQGSADGTVTEGHVGATLKHFVGHGQKEGGRNKAPANISEHLLRDIHLEPFRIAIREAKPRGVMPSYNEVDGVPMHMNRYLIKDVLQGEFGFEGMIASDYTGVKELSQFHQVCDSLDEAALLAFNAGVEFDLPIGECFEHLVKLVNDGKVSEKDIDKAVRKILTLKFELGLFDNPYVTLDEARSIAHDSLHWQLAREVAQQSIVLLKNNDNLLPLDTKKYKRIAVIGPNANDTRLGEYSGIPYYKVSVLDGLRNRFADCQFTYAEGCRITNTHSTDSRKTWFTLSTDDMLPTKEQNMPRIAEAVRVARGADAVVMVLGENELVCREAFMPLFRGDNTTLDLISQQNELFEAVKATGKPVIVCLMHGRPLSINSIAEKADAILDLWYAGQETGNAVADIISGDVNPSGKITVTYPKSVGMLPVWYNRKPTSGLFNYVNEDFGWLFPFGYGLSYTQFDYSDLKLSSKTMDAKGSITLSCNVKNTGSVDGYEVVELYIRDIQASVTRPVKELKGFKKVFVKAGESVSVEFNIDSSALEFWNIDRKYTVEPGDFVLMIGRSSEDICLSDTLRVE